MLLFKLTEISIEEIHLNYHIFPSTPAHFMLIMTPIVVDILKVSPYLEEETNMNCKLTNLLTEHFKIALLHRFHRIQVRNDKFEVDAEEFNIQATWIQINDVYPLIEKKATIGFDVLNSDVNYDDFDPEEITIFLNRTRFKFKSTNTKLLFYPFWINSYQNVT